MQNTSKQRETQSHPQDKSFEAYKVWVEEISKRLTTDYSKVSFTEAEWKANWRQFWNQWYGG